MKPKRTFIILANDHNARFLVHEGPGQGLRELEAVANARAEEYADGPGRSQAAPGAARHGVAPSTSPEDQSRAGFADLVAEISHRMWAEGGYDRAALAAAPKMLGLLRGALDDAILGALVGDLDKDLLNIRTADLAGHFDDMILV